MDQNKFLAACKKGNIKELQKTIDEGADLESEFDMQPAKEHPLFVAKNKETAQFLFDNGIEFHSIDFAGMDEDKPVIQHLIDKAKTDDDIGVIEVVAMHDDTLNTNWNFNGGYAIHSAIESGNVNIVKAILAGGGALNLLTNDGETPLGIAAKNSNEEIVSLLIEAGAPLAASEYFFAIEQDEECYVKEPIDEALNENIKGIIMAAIASIEVEKNIQTLNVYLESHGAIKGMIKDSTETAGLISQRIGVDFDDDQFVMTLHYNQMQGSENVVFAMRFTLNNAFEVATNKHLFIALLGHRINNKMRVGGFWFDLDTGDITFNAGFIVGPNSLTYESLDLTYDYISNVIENYIPIIRTYVISEGTEDDYAEALQALGNI